MKMKIYTKYLDQSKYLWFLNQVPEERHYKYEDTFVSDELCLDRLYWDKKKPIFISAPCGCGKTTFVEDYAKEFKNDKFLIVSNRVALNSQIKRRLCEKLDQEKLMLLLTDEGINELKEIGNVTVITYQSLAETSMKYLQEYSVVVADELHSIFTEATYFPKSHIALEKICSMRNAIRIYMSATPRNVFDLALEKELQFFVKENSFLLNLGYSMKLEPIFYEFSKSEKPINSIKFFDTINSLKSELTKRSDYKTLIFVDTIKKGKELKTIISSWGKKVTLISSESKIKGNEGFEDYSEIVKYERFSKADVVVSTAVLREGVNLKMALLRNIVFFDFPDYEGFYQSIGRFRTTEGATKVNVFIRLIDSEDITKRLEMLVLSKNRLLSLAAMSQFEVERMMNIGKNTEFVGLYYFEKGILKMNPLAMHRINREIWKYEALKSKIDEEPLISVALMNEWIRLDGITEHDLLIERINKQEELIAELHNLLIKNRDLVLEHDRKEVFRRKFTSLFCKLKGLDYPEKPYGLKLINQKITEIDLPFILYSERGKWKVTCLESEDDGDE